jgi:hypothetical protein
VWYERLGKYQPNWQGLGENIAMTLLSEANTPFGPLVSERRPLGRGMTVRRKGRRRRGEGGGDEEEDDSDDKDENDFTKDETAEKDSS